MDEELEKDTGKEYLTELKKKQPPNKSPLFKLLGEMTNSNAGGSGE